jgi:hypothetical protein
MNIVGIDPSLISTAMVVNGKIINYCREKDAANKSGLSKWFKMSEGFCELRYISYRKFENYSEGEITKLMDYDNITTNIVNDIIDNIDSMDETKVMMEGYNFGAQVGDLLDLVTFSTLLRKKIFDQITEDIIIISPTQLKLESCKLTYPPIEREVGVRKKRIEKKWVNNIGIAGGNFTKTHMLLSIIENNEIDSEWFKHVKSIKDDILYKKTVPKPYEDINDAILMYHILEKQLIPEII